MQPSEIKLELEDFPRLQDRGVYTAWRFLGNVTSCGLFVFFVCLINFHREKEKEKEAGGKSLTFWFPHTALLLLSPT